MDPYKKLKEQLLKRKEELERQLDLNNEFGMEIPYASSQASGELSQYDNHPADEGTQLFEREKDFILRKMAHEELSDINHALAKFENGTYGVDEVTGEKIPLARLEAMPTARTTKEHSPNQEMNDDRPIEEKVIRNMEEEYATGSDETEYNEQNAWDLVASFNENSMTFDDASLMDNEDGMGYVELVEAIGATDIEGYRGDDHVQFMRNIQYDKWMNQDDVAEDDESY
ncbi:regulatory protein [Tuberibacillus calidus]|uniref:regulatory protein n=1 Tax=Tuberibacillus calidus TaxID=340097 RepID=UPI00040D003E|nr:regulatory protein [Tuberibacillus calidus]